ncbi:MAG: hypothetical protein R6W71_04655 [Bacteroidales bacterium]
MTDKNEMMIPEEVIMTIISCSSSTTSNNWSKPDSWNFYRTSASVSDSSGIVGYNEFKIAVLFFHQNNI